MKFSDRFIRLMVFVMLALSLLALACSLSGEAIPTPAGTAVPVETELPAATDVLVAGGSVEPVFEETDCALSLPADVAVTCGFVEVTEDRTGDPADTIRLAVAVYHSPYVDETAVPIFYLQGGPGAPAVSWSDGFYQVFIQPLLAHGDVIFMDHRGTGLSEPSMYCDEIQDVYIDDFQSEWNEVTRSSNYAAAFLSCRTRLIREGVNIKAYTTTEAAADVRDVAAVLGVERVNIYGVSYGTRLGQAVMRDYPELVNAAVLDSVVPLEANLYNDTTSRANYALETLFDGCAADPACSAAYPDLEEHFYSVLTQFDENPVAVEVVNPASGEQLSLTVGNSSLVNAMVWALHSPDYVAQTPQIVEAVYQGDNEMLGLVKALPYAGLTDINVGLRLSVECHEQIFPTTVEALEADIQAYPALTDYGYSAIYGSPEFVFRACQLWGAAAYDPVDKAPLHSSIPALILAGQYDPTTPAYYGRQLADNLTNSYFYEFAGQGHAPSVGTYYNCALAVALDFLADPETEPAAPCLLEPGRVPFIVPYDGSVLIIWEPVVNQIHNLTALLPAGWVFIGNGFYNREQYLGDPVQIGFQSSNVSAAEWLVFLKDNFQNRGLVNIPKAAGTYEDSNGRLWDLYTATAHNDSVNIALLERPGDLTWLVIMVNNTAERDTMVEHVFLPVIDSIQIVDGG